MDHTHTGDLEASALLTGSGACVIYLGEVHIQSVTLMPALRSTGKSFISPNARDARAFFARAICSMTDKRADCVEKPAWKIRQSSERV